MPEAGKTTSAEVIFPPVNITPEPWEFHFRGKTKYFVPEASQVERVFDMKTFVRLLSFLSLVILHRTLPTLQ